MESKVLDRKLLILAIECLNAWVPASAVLVSECHMPCIVAHEEKKNNKVLPARWKKGNKIY